MIQTLAGRTVSLRTSLLWALGSLCFAGSLVLLFSLDRMMKSHLERMAVTSMTHMASDVRRHLDRELYERFRDVQSLVMPVTHARGNLGQIRALIAHAASTYPDYSWLAFVDPSGMVRVGNRGLLEGKSVAGRPWFPPSRQAPFVGDVHDAALLADILGPDKFGQAPRFIDFGFPIRDENGHLTGVLAAHLNWQWSGELLEFFENRTGQDEPHTLLITSRDGTVLHGPGGEIGTVLPQAAGLDGDGMWRDEMGVIHVVAQTKGFAGMPGFGWKLVVRAPESTIYALSSTLRRTVLLGAIPVIALFVAFGLMLARWIARPIERLDAAASAGQDIPVCTRFVETASLARAFQGMVDALRQDKQDVERKVQQRTAELSELLSAFGAHAIVSMADARGRIVYCNDKFCDISGYTREELLGQNHNIVRSNHHPTEFFTQMWTTIRSGQIWQGVICNRRRDGSDYWVQSTIAPIQENPFNGAVYLSVRTDITDVVRDRERLRRLSQEFSTFRQIIDSTTEAVSVMDGDGNYTYCNPARERITGFSLDQLKHMHISQVVADEGQPLIAQIMDTVRKNQSWRGLLPLRRADGSFFVSSSNIGVAVDEASATQVIFNVFHDYTDELRHTRELEEARNVAERANRAKSDFLSSMSHELRTPLNAILGFAQLLLTSPKHPLNERQQDQVRHILSGGEHLLQLINEVLELARIEAGKLNLSLEPIALKALMAECAQMAAPIMQRYQVTLTAITCCCAEKLHVLADRVRTRQVILNLLSNAAKYNRPRGSVTLSCQEQPDGMVRVAVSDTGPGIARDKMAELFQPFNRLGAESSGIEGTGIGLTLSKSLMESMGGQIGVNSIVGEGTTFWLDFPAIPHESTGATADTEDFSPLPVPLADHKARILYVEDNPANIQLMESIADMFDGIALTTAISAEAGLKVVRQFPPDLMILDVNLPGMSGTEMVRLLKSDPATSFIPVIALSADNTERSIRQGLEAGFDAWLSKPVRIAELMDHITRAVEAKA